MHPRNKSVLQSLNLSLNHNLNLTDPIGYIDFLALMKNAELVITDSGGIKEETTYLGVQCITVRNNTERPIMVEVGTNYLTGIIMADIESTATKILNREKKKGRIPEFWNGKSSERIVEKLVNSI